MDDYISIKDRFETMDDETLLAVKDELEALRKGEVEDDAWPVRGRIVDMCYAVIAERTMAVMRQKVAAVVDEHNHSANGILLEYLTITKRIERITSIIEDSCRALLTPDYERITMTFEELADAKHTSVRMRCFNTRGSSRYYSSMIGMDHYVRIKTSWADTTFTVYSRKCIYVAPCSLGRGNGKRAKNSIADIKAIAAAATEGATLANPPDHKEQ